MLGIELVANSVTRAPFGAAERVGRRVTDHARSHGVLLRPLGDVVVVMPPLSITGAEIDLLAQAVSRTIFETLPDGFN